MVRTLDPRAIVLPDGVLTTEAKADRATISALKRANMYLE